MLKIAGITGSAKRNSLNAALLAAASESAPDDVEIVVGKIADVPLYNGKLVDGDLQKRPDNFVSGFADFFRDSDIGRST